MSHLLIFTFADDRVIEYEVDEDTAKAVDDKLRWGTGATFYFVRFTDATGIERRVNLPHVAWVTIRTDWRKADQP